MTTRGKNNNKNTIRLNDLTIKKQRVMITIFYSLSFFRSRLKILQGIGFPNSEELISRECTYCKLLFSPIPLFGLEFQLSNRFLCYVHASLIRLF